MAASLLHPSGGGLSKQRCANADGQMGEEEACCLVASRP